MEKTDQKSENCQSIFQSGEDAEIRIRFTQKWIEYINLSEKNKGRKLPET